MIPAVLFHKNWEGTGIRFRVPGAVHGELCPIPEFPLKFVQLVEAKWDSNGIGM